MSHRLGWRCRTSLALRRFALATLLVSSAASAVYSNGPAPAVAAEPSTSEPRFVPSVIGAFNGLSTRADGLAVLRGSAPEATTCKHHQGMARTSGPDGTQYMVFTRSGNQFTSLCSGGDESGALFVARMDSRDKHGERLRTNLMPYFDENGVSLALRNRPNVLQDGVVSVVRLDGTNGWPAFRHPGGMQIADDVIAIGTEVPFGGESHRAAILFVDLTDPESPRLASRFDPPNLDVPNGEFGTDPVGLIPIRAADGSCCRYLMVAAGGDANEQVRFFRSRPTPPSTTKTDLKSDQLTWDEVGRYSESGIEDCLGADWPTSGLIQGGQHQLLNFVREGDLDGPLFLVGGRRDGLIANPTADEFLDLYRVNVNPDGTMPATCPLTHIATEHMGEAAWGERTYTGSFSAASGVHISPSGELIVYVSNHESNNGVVVFGEFRIGSLVRANSPPSAALRPSATVDGPVAVDEGATTSLVGHGKQPIQKAYIQLFDDNGSGVNLTGARWLNIEFEDRDELPFEDLSLLGLRDNNGVDEIYEEANSWRWFAPSGCTISANDLVLSHDEWPGEDTVLLRGRGRVEEVQHLDDLSTFQPSDEIWPVSPAPAGEPATFVDYHNDVAGITFFHQVAFGGGVANRHTCETYYNATIGLTWDLDNNGTFETSGATATFNALLLDGPSTATAGVRAKHPTDNTALGSSDTLPVSIGIRNVPPLISLAAVTDSLGRDLVGTGLFALVGLPVRLAVDFTDPGRPDTQTGLVTWGDGSSNSAFSTFTDAQGGVVGHLRHAHVYGAPGTYTIVATITDDDGGATPVERTIQVLSLEDAIEDLADELTTLIAQTTNPVIRAFLTSARNDLIGSNGGSAANGALDKLQGEEFGSAITKMRSAIDSLQAAESRGAGDFTSLKDLMGLVAEGIATTAYERARTGVPSPTPRQAAKLAEIADLIVQGHAKLINRQYLAACDNFKQAADKAVGLR